MFSFVLGLFILSLYVIIKSDKEKRDIVDLTGLVGLLCLAWGIGRYNGTGPKPIWDPN